MSEWIADGLLQAWSGRGDVGRKAEKALQEDGCDE